MNAIRFWRLAKKSDETCFIESMRLGDSAGTFHNYAKHGQNSFGIFAPGPRTVSSAERQDFSEICPTIHGKPRMLMKSTGYADSRRCSGTLSHLSPFTGQTSCETELRVIT